MPRGFLSLAPRAPARRRAFAALGAALLAGGCAVLAPTPADYRPPAPGTTWVNGRMDTGSYGSGAAQTTWRRSERLWEGERLASFETPQGATLANARGQWVVQLAPNGRPVSRFDPPIGYEWPLEVGKTWRRTHRATNLVTNQSVEFEVTWTVEASETIKVPAGTFRTLRIRYRDTLGSDDTYWFSPRHGIAVRQNLRRSAQHPAGAGTRDVEVVSLKISK